MRFSETDQVATLDTRTKSYTIDVVNNQRIFFNNERVISNNFEQLISCHTNDQLIVSIGKKHDE